VSTLQESSQLTRRALLRTLAGRTSKPRESSGDVLVFVTLWGGFDGLTAVPPIGDPYYAPSRPTIAVPRESAIQLDRLFGLHPSLAPLKPFWDDRQLAVVHAVGIPYPTRSHFEAQADLGQAAPGSSLKTGFLNRMLGTLPGSSALRAVQVGDSVLVASLLGPEPITTIWEVGDFRLDGQEWYPQLASTIGKLYDGLSAPCAATAADTLKACELLTPLAGKTYVPSPGVVYPAGLLSDALQGVAELVKADVGVKVAAVDYGDWDFHAALGQCAGGAMAVMLDELGQSLAAFAADLGPALDKVTIVTVSEFGRRVAENGSGGVDHGHGNAMFVLGGGVKGGQVYGKWPTLAPSALDGGDLMGTTDYRSVLAEVLVRRCGVGSLSRIFPQFTPTFLGLA
jgi:uncharacterized protein (DUF1501 family)